MNESNVVRWLGMICLLAGIARIGMTPTSFIWGTDSTQELTFGYIACILMSVGTIAIYLVQAKETGVTGFITTLLMSIGNVMTTALVFSAFTLEPGAAMPEGPVVAISRMAGMIGMLLGTLVFTILTYRAKVFPRWIVFLNVLMLLSIALPIADNKLFALFWGLTYVGMGYCIWTGKLNAGTVSAKAEAEKAVRA